MLSKQMKYADWMTKEQAAERIGVSVKTVERMADNQKLQKRQRARAGGSPVAVFHPGDVDRAASARNKAQAAPFVISDAQSKTNTPAIRAEETIGDRAVALEFVELLGAAIAKGLNAVKPSDLIFTPSEAAWYAKRSEKALQQLRRDGRLPNAGTSRRVLYRRVDLDKL